MGLNDGWFVDPGLQRQALLVLARFYYETPFHKAYQPMSPQHEALFASYTETVTRLEREDPSFASDLALIRAFAETTDLDIEIDASHTIRDGVPSIGGGFTIDQAGAPLHEQGFVIPPYLSYERYVSDPTENTTSVLAAEYAALIAAMEFLLSVHHDPKKLRLSVKTDSNILVEHMNFRGLVRRPHLVPIHERVRHLSQQFGSVRVEKIPRDQNGRAHELAVAHRP